MWSDKGSTLLGESFGIPCYFRSGFERTAELQFAAGEHEDKARICPLAAAVKLNLKEDGLDKKLKPLVEIG